MQAWVDPGDLCDLPWHVTEGAIERFPGQAETKGETDSYRYDPRKRPILFLWGRTSSGLEDWKGCGPSLPEVRYQRLLESRS
jgi:hypothetical protein